MNSKSKGIITEHKVISKLLELGYTVSHVIGDNSPYDIVLEIDSKLYKVQIKTARYYRGSIVFNTESCRINTKGFYKTNYLNKCDFFVAWYPDKDKFYMLDVNKCARGNATLKDSEPKNNQKKNVMVAKEFELEKMLKEI